MKREPVLQALILADHVYVDSATGKKIIAGTFNRLWLRKKAQSDKESVSVEGEKRLKAADVAHAGSPYLYVNLTEVLGKLPLTVRYVDLEDSKVLLHTKFTVECDDPLQNCEIVLMLPPLPAVKAGPHALELLCGDDTPLGSLRIIADERKDEEQGHDDT